MSQNLWLRPSQNIIAQIPIDDDIIIQYQQLNQEIQGINQIQTCEEVVISNKVREFRTQCLSQIQNLISGLSLSKKAINLTLLNQWCEIGPYDYQYSLEFILENQNELITQAEDGLTPVQLLNQNLKSIEFIVLRWLEDQFKKSDYHLYYQEDSQDNSLQLYKTIKDQMKRQFLFGIGTPFRDLSKCIKKSFQDTIDNQQISDPKISNEDLKQIDHLKTLLNGLQDYVFQEFILKIQSELGFIPSNVLTYKYEIKIKNFVITRFQQRLVQSWSENQQAFMMLKNHASYQLSLYLQQGCLHGGLMEISQAHKIIWIILSQTYVSQDQVEVGLYLVDEIIKLHDQFQIEKASQTRYNELKNMIKQHEKKFQFSCEYQILVKSASQKWSQSTKELDNLNIIFQLYIILGGFRLYSPQNIKVGAYKPESKVFLIKLLRLLKNGENGYLNISYIQIIDSLISKILDDCYNQIKGKFHLQNQQLLQQGVLDFIGQQVLENQVSSSQIPSPRDSLIIKDPSNDHQYQYTMIMDEYKGLPPSYVQFQYLKQHFVLQSIRERDRASTETLIQQIIAQHKQSHELEKLSPPSRLNILKISDKDTFARTITICISGYTSENEDKINKWKHVFKKYGNEVFTIDWKCGTLQDISSYFASGFVSLAAMSLAISTVSYLFVCIQIPTVLTGLASVYNSNPFAVAFDEAVSVGTYLGYMIGKLNIFGKCQINLIGFSLGTVVVQKIVQTLDAYQIESKTPKIVNQVVFLGGVADVTILQSMSFCSVARNVINVHSKCDTVLIYLLKAAKFHMKPCGND